MSTKRIMRHNIKNMSTKQVVTSFTMQNDIFVGYVFLLLPQYGYRSKADFQKLAILKPTLKLVSRFTNVQDHFLSLNH